MRSSALLSHRSPNCEHPMPRIATLSRIPLAIAFQASSFGPFTGAAFQK